MNSILLLTTKYKHPNGSPWLVSELAEELAARGAQVTVLNLDWDRTPMSHIHGSNPRVLNFRAVRPSRWNGGTLGKWAFSAFKLVPFMLGKAISRKRYDLVISFSPCAALHLSTLLARGICGKSFLIYWDIFPLHNQAIKKNVPDKFLSLLKKLERHLVCSFDTIGCMGSGNRSAFLKYFDIDGSNVKITPIWTSILRAPSIDRNLIRHRYYLLKESLVFAFGGQLVAGRGVEKLCNAFSRVAEEIGGVVLAFCGAGPLEHIVKEYEKISAGAIRLIGSLPRNEYIEFLTASDVGVISAISGGGTSSFPSKSLDYLACNLPLFAVLEADNDLSRIIFEKNIGAVCNEDESDSIYFSVKRLIEKRRYFSELGKNGNVYLNSRHSVSAVAAEFIEMSNV